MRAKRIVGAVAAIAMLGALATGLVLVAQLFRVAREANRPDVARYPVAQAERNARANGIEARVERVLFVDQDVNAAIFVARNVRIDPAFVKDGRYLATTRRWGVARVRRLGGDRALVSYCAATTRGEWAQAREWFPAEEERAARVIGAR